MSDEKAKADTPKVIGVEMAPETLEKLGELLPAIALWAKREGNEGETGPGDVIALAIGVLHAQVFERAHDMIAGEVAPTVQ